MLNEVVYCPRLFYLEHVAGEWEDIHLLRRGELEGLFGSAVPERLGPLVKSWISVRPVGQARR